MLQGKRVTLRPLREDDLENFLKWINDLKVFRFLKLYLPTTEIAEKEWIREASTSKTQVIFVIEVVTENGMTISIGNCGLTNINHKDQDAVFGIVIGDKDYRQREGYGTEATTLIIDYAFKWLNLNRISSSAWDFNKRSIGFHKKVGFEREGIRRQAVFRDGQFRDELIFGLLREEWKKE